MSTSTATTTTLTLTQTRTIMRTSTGTRTARSTVRSSGRVRAFARCRRAWRSSASPPRSRRSCSRSRDSVALLADLIHNGGDALTAIPLAIAFLMRSERGERCGRVRGRAHDLRVGVCRRVRSDQPGWCTLSISTICSRSPWPGSSASSGTSWPRRVRLRAGARLDSPALIADGQHARVDGFVSLGVIASAGRGRGRPEDRRPDRRPRDHCVDPADHGAGLAHDPGGRRSPVLGQPTERTPGDDDAGR